MRSRTAHQLNEVPVLLCRVTVTHNVADNLRIDLRSGIKTERSLNLRVLQVAVNRLRTADYLNTCADSLVVLSQHACVGVRVITTDDNECLDAQLVQYLQSLVELLLLLKLRTTGTDDIKATGITVLINDVSCQFHIVMIYQTTRTEDKSVQLIGRVQLLDTVEEAGDDVVSARCLAAREDYTDIHLSRLHLAIDRLKG